MQEGGLLKQETVTFAMHLFSDENYQNVDPKNMYLSVIVLIHIWSVSYYFGRLAQI